MKSYVLVAPEKGRVELQEARVGDPAADEVQVRVKRSLISQGTERAFILNLPNTPGKYPYYPGYSATGVIEKTGPGVKELHEGDRVFCGTSHCSLANVNESRIVRIPGDVPWEHAVFATIGQIALQGLRKTHIELGEKVVVIGLGAIGLLAVQLARLDGAFPSIGVDRFENRIAIAGRCGADLVLNAGEDNWQEKLGGAPNVVIELTGSPDAVRTALEVAAPYGRVSLTGCSRGESTVNLYREVVLKTLTLVGAHATFGVPKSESRPGYWTRKDDLNVIMRLIEAGKLVVAPLITDHITPDRIEQAYAQIFDRNQNMVGVIICWS